MFVVCPSCAGPFRIPADQIAPLVQIACPHCAFRMILDFEAANEPSLVERGTLFAQGFENAEAYFSVYSHIGPQTDVSPRPVQPPVQEAPRPVETAKPFETPRPVEAPVQARRPPSSPAATPVSTPTPTPVSAEPPAKPVEPTTTPPGRVGAKTIIQHPKKPASMVDPSARVETTPAASGPSMRQGHKPAEPVATEAKAEPRAVSEPTHRAPPHTPPAATAVSNAPASEPPATPKPEDIAAASGTHPSKTEDKRPTPAQEAASNPPAGGEKKPVAQPPDSGGSNVILIGIVLFVVVAVIVAVYLNMK